MIKVLADASLANLDIFFGASFQLTRYEHQQDLPHLLASQDVLLCRSTLRVGAELLQGSSIRCVATASSGTDHIDTQYLQQHHIALLDAKGSNAKAVADYVMACMAFLQTNYNQISPVVGVMGMGMVGSLVAARLRALGFELFCYDPPRSRLDPDFMSCTLEELLHCDLLCLHANLHDDAPDQTRHWLNADLLSRLKPQTMIINASRGAIVDEEALLACAQPLVYCTDVYADEPNISPALVGYATLCTPHIAGHSIEARLEALRVLSEKILHFFGCEMSVLTAETSILSLNPESWQQDFLSLYDPMVETQLLKQAKALRTTFLALRQAHHRHEWL